MKIIALLLLKSLFKKFFHVIKFFLNLFVINLFTNLANKGILSYSEKQFINKKEGGRNMSMKADITKNQNIITFKTACLEIRSI